jgi:hypothetical protein
MPYDVLLFGADPTGKKDSTAAIQLALDAAGAAMGSSFTEEGIYWATQPIVDFPPGVYQTTKPLRVPQSLVLNSFGRAMLIAAPDDKTFDCFVWEKAWRATVRGLGFRGYQTALRMPTGNIDLAMINVQSCTAQACTNFLDTVSYAASRSTLTKVTDCILYGTPMKIYTDVATIDGCWLYNCDNTDAILTLDSKASITNCVAVPAGAGPQRRWIDFYSSELGRSLSIRDCRFGGEGGRYPFGS